ncbi:DUF1795 domain-containing protein [Desulfosarcina sp. OttesenSCG-928-G10]|nr:DUF1795 domain-containing protein [Desulfosarcina sp. OttesenSCG-928-G10]
MKYMMQEGTLALPDATEDRTVNIFQMTGVGKGESCNLVVNRDVCEAGETLEAYVSRQLKLLGRTMRSMKETARREAVIGTPQVPAMEIEVRSTDVSTGRVQYQILACCKLSDRSVLLFTLTSPSPLSEALRSDWQRIIGSFSPYAA